MFSVCRVVLACYLAKFQANTRTQIIANVWTLALRVNERLPGRSIEREHSDQTEPWKVAVILKLFLR